MTLSLSPVAIPIAITVVILCLAPRALKGHGDFDLGPAFAFIVMAAIVIGSWVAFGAYCLGRAG